ncbi:MAG TPA: hypothetical protein VF707_14840 [Ardenticatenaceae bacterium]|jgi:hypothetical protein
MTTRLTDTHPDAEHVQIELLRHATTAQRFHLVRSLSETTMRLAWRAIERANPHATQEEIALRFVAVHYGQALADALRADLARRRDGRA